MPATNAAVTMSDASPSASAPASGEAAASSAEAKPEAAKSEPVKSEAEARARQERRDRFTDDKPAEARPRDQSSRQSTNRLRREAATRSRPAEQLKAEAAAKTETSVEAERPKRMPRPTPKADAPKADAPKAADRRPRTKAAEKPAEPAKAVADAPAVAPDAKKDPSRLPGAEKAAAAKAEPPKRTGQIAVFVSRKDGKLYVRQNFAPLFDVPVTIAPSERMLGTHVFTAEADKNDPNKLRWSVVSLPVTARNAARNDDDDRAARRRKVAGGAPAEVKPAPAPNSPAEALDRITIPPDAMARITEALTTGGSIMVSDQGINQGETGEGTDFIVSLR